MQEYERRRWMESRRGWLAMAAGALVSWAPVPIYGFAAQDFWNKKDPDQWTSDEIRKLLTRSPWAKEVAAEKSAAVKKSQTVRDPTVGMPRSPGKSSTRLPGTSQGQGQGPREPAPRTFTTYRGTVVWESAAPIRAADKTPLPEEFADMYVLSVGGVPLVATRQQEDGSTPRASKSALDRLRQATTLEIKGHDPLEAAVAKQITDNGNVFFFGFARKALEISKDEKEVTFVTHMNKLRFAAKFNVREMLYHAELAI